MLLAKKSFIGLTGWFQTALLLYHLFYHANKDGIVNFNTNDFLRFSGFQKTPKTILSWIDKLCAKGLIKKVGRGSRNLIFEIQPIVFKTAKEADDKILCGIDSTHSKITDGDEKEIALINKLEMHVDYSNDLNIPLYKNKLIDSKVLSGTSLYRKLNSLENKNIIKTTGTRGKPNLKLNIDELYPAENKLLNCFKDDYQDKFDPIDKSYSKNTDIMKSIKGFKNLLKKFNFDKIKHTIENMFDHVSNDYSISRLTTVEGFVNYFETASKIVQKKAPFKRKKAIKPAVKKENNDILTGKTIFTQAECLMLQPKERVCFKNKKHLYVGICKNCPQHPSKKELLTEQVIKKCLSGSKKTCETPDWKKCNQKCRENCPEHPSNKGKKSKWFPSFPDKEYIKYAEKFIFTHEIKSKNAFYKNKGFFLTEFDNYESFLGELFIVTNHALRGFIQLEYKKGFTYKTLQEVITEQKFHTRLIKNCINSFIRHRPKKYKTKELDENGKPIWKFYKIVGLEPALNQASESIYKETPEIAEYLKEFVIPHISKSDNQEILKLFYGICENGISYSFDEIGNMFFLSAKAVQARIDRMINKIRELIISGEISSPPPEILSAV